MPIWALFVWLLFGAIAGYVASLIAGRPGRYGLVGDIVVGLLGSVIGGYLFSLLDIGPGVGGWIGSLIVAVVGAVVLIFALRALAPRV